MALLSINPATEEILASFDEMTAPRIEEALSAADRAQRKWRRVPARDRAPALRSVAACLRERKDRLARLITIEMGKPISQAEFEVEKCAWNCDFYAEHAERFLADQRIPTNARESYVAFDPLGVILLVMPWNFPIWQVFRSAAPALMAGNAVVLKHSSNVPQCALAIEEVFRDSALPDGLMRTLLVSSRAVPDIVADDRIKAIALTGSDRAGAEVGQLAARAVKKALLELGGSDPFIVLDDADLDMAAQVGALARNLNAGQSCISAKRFIVVEKIADGFEQRLAAAVGALKVGDPLQHETQIGPLARDDLRDTLKRQVRASIEAGARVVFENARVPERGYFYAPTLLSVAERTMPVWCEETFGPVAVLLRVADETEAVAAANSSPYGLGASVWTTDVERGQRVARELESGAVFINGMVASDPRLPFGGVKRSGYGRELGEFGIREFTNIRTVWVGPATA